MFFFSSLDSFVKRVKCTKLCEIRFIKEMLQHTRNYKSQSDLLTMFFDINSAFWNAEVVHLIK